MVQLTAPASLTHPSVALVAHLTLTVTRATLFFTDARCPACNRLVMSIPGRRTIEVRAVQNNAARSGRGPVVGCARCKTLCEVVEHR